MPPLSESTRTKEIIALLRKLFQANVRYTKELNKKYQVSAPQLICLLTLLEWGPLPPSKIALKIMVNSSTVTGIIDRLEQKGLVQRNRNSRDRRVVNIELTSVGRTLAENAPPPIQSKIVDSIESLPQEDVDEIIRVLSKLGNMLDTHDMDGDQPV